MKVLPFFTRLLFGLCLMPLSLVAQVQDNFADGDFTANPVWGGINAKFEVNAGLLHLNAPTISETAYLSTPSTLINNASWEFYFRYDESPSSSNFTRVYLVSSQADLTGSLNGYFVMIGNTTKEVSLYKQTGTTRTEIIDGIDRNGGSNPPDFASLTKVKVKVTRDASGNWSLYTDTSPTGPTGSFVLEGTFTDNTHTGSSFTGVYITYTSTRSTFYWFDDFIVEPVSFPDITPPSVTNISMPNATTVSVLFSEPVENVSAQITANYLIENSSPLSAVVQSDQVTVLLSLNVPLVNGLTYSIMVEGVSDASSNVMSPTLIDKLYFVPSPVAHKDIIVSEFMADPSPFVSLPEAEFIELYNRSANPVSLENWKLTDGSATAILPFYILMPAAYITITTTSASASFNSALGVANFPSLNNSGDNIILKTNEVQMIDSIRYTTNWYRSEDKQEGGWSLEIIDPENLCEEEGNWTASENSNGGTPGAVNSVNASNPDLTAPIILSGVIKSANEIVIAFNEKLDGNANISATVEPLINVVSVSYSYDLRQLKIKTVETLVAGIIYTVTLNNAFDCPGNALIENTAELILPEAALPGDILLNEILFNPKSGGVDFVEVYNASNKYISLKKWSLANLENDVPVNGKVFEGDWIISPKTFRVFTSDPAILKAHYPRGSESNFLNTTLPSLSDDAGSIVVMDSLGARMDFLLYQDDFHTQFLKDKEGVSLERVSLTAITNNANNWRSASQQENFATPGYKNSASSDGAAPAAGEIIVEPEIFSPQVPPNDFTTINYKFNQSGKVVNAQILDQQGHLIKTLANNEVLGTEGFFRWDGDQDDGGRARAGYYVIWIEVFDDRGHVNTFRKRVVVFFQ